MLICLSKVIIFINLSREKRSNMFCISVRGVMSYLQPSNTVSLDTFLVFKGWERNWKF